MQKSFYPFIILLLLCNNNLHAQEENAPEKLHGISASFFQAWDGWRDSAPVFEIGYRQRKFTNVNITPKASAGVGIYRPFRGGMVERLSYVAFFKGGFVTTFQGKYLGFRIDTDLAVKYSPVRWAGSNVSLGPSLNFALGTGTAIKRWELNLLLLGADIYFVEFNMPGGSQVNLLNGTLRTPGLNFIYYFAPSN